MKHVDKNRDGDFYCLPYFGQWAIVGPDGFIVQMSKNRYTARITMAALAAASSAESDSPNAKWSTTL